MKSGLMKLLFMSVSICTLIQCAEKTAVGTQQVLITNATNRLVVVRAMRRLAGKARWECLTTNDPAFYQPGIFLSSAERRDMTLAIALNPGESRKLSWLESWKFDLIFAPLGSDLADKITQGRCSVSQREIVSDLHEGNWRTIQPGSRVILYFVPSEASKRYLLHNDITKNLIGRKGHQTEVVVGKINVAVLREGDKKLTPAQADIQQRAFIEVVAAENQ